MRRVTALGYILVIVSISGLLSVACNSNSNPTDKILGHAGVTAENGLSLTADPAKIVIDPADPATPTDPAHGDERYGETVLTATALDPSGAPQADLDLTFGTAAGVLASGGAAVKTDANGVAHDTLRVYESDPDSIQVSVSDISRITTATVTKLVAEPPVADAGPDQTVECTGNSSARVKLNGTGSTDPNGDIVQYEWFENYGTSGETLLGTGAMLQIGLPLGSHVITLRVTDATAKTATDDVTIDIVDTTPPKVTLRVRPFSLWPPNHRMVDIHATVSVDECGPYQVVLESITSNEPDNGLGDGDTANDIQGAALGTEGYDFSLRAERAGGGSGRVYTVTYRVIDAVGLETTASAEVVVPHDQGNN
jgi:K319L-like, PKD domain